MFEGRTKSCSFGERRWLSYAREPGAETGVLRPPWRRPERGLMAVLLERRQAQPLHQCVHVLESRGRELRSLGLSVQELFAWAEGAAGALEAAGVGARDRVLLSLEDPRVLGAWFLGAIGRGIIPVVLPPATGFGNETRHRQRIAGIVADCSPRLAVVEDAARWPFDLKCIERPPIVEADAVGAVGRSRPLSDQPLEEVAFLQYTSGSTGEPKGVVVTHENLVSNLSAISCGMGVAPGERMISWLPLHHDMGLVGALLWPIFCGGETFIMTPLTFLSQPAAWLRAVARYRGTATVAPNFAYSVCARKVKDRDLDGVDLSTLRLAMCGAEPVDNDVVRAFETRLARYGLRRGVFYPVYGLAEATLAVAFPEPGAQVIVDVVDRTELASGCAEPARPGTAYAQEIVSVGRALPGHSVEIVSASTGLACAERRVGEVVVRGPSIAPRYWSESVETKRSALGTGDLGYLVDNRLYLVDRLKDIIIIAGKNYSPTDIETAAADVHGVRMGRVVAFGSRRPELGTEVTVLVAEIDPYSDRDPAAVRTAITAAVRRRIGLDPEVIIVRPGWVDKTTSGKLRRRACVAQYQAGSLPVVDDLAAVRRLRRRTRFARVITLVRAILSPLDPLVRRTRRGPPRAPLSG